jgi:hypothetical protein
MFNTVARASDYYQPAHTVYGFTVDIRIFTWVIRNDGTAINIRIIAGASVQATSVI